MADARGWYERQSKGGKVAFLISTVLAILIMGGLIAHALSTHTPHEGQSCLGASESEVNAWVQGKQSEIPSDVSISAVEGDVSGICTDAQTSHESQSFDAQLLEIAVEEARGEG